MGVLLLYLNPRNVTIGFERLEENITLDGLYVHIEQLCKPLVNA